ncbi:hypothetical protein [Neisseria musculi]|nr:hypothetical protein [Neisseria musculi]
MIWQAYDKAAKSFFLVFESELRGFAAPSGILGTFKNPPNEPSSKKRKV